jgi:hypothetical protein
MIQKTIDETVNPNQNYDQITERSSYILLFEGDSISEQPSEGLQTVRVRSIDEAANLLSMLGDGCELYLSPEYRLEHPDLTEKLLAISSPERIKDDPVDIQTASELMQKLPLDLKSLVGSHIALRPEDPKPAPIAKNQVHKNSESNVLISEPLSVGNLHYFNMFLDTTELVFDHPSDHVQGMLILEALRQAGIATAHLHGLPVNGKLALLIYDTNFFSFIETGSPIVLRSFSNFYADENSENMDYFVCIQAMQWGKVCTETVIKALACMNNQRREKINKQLEKIALRNKTNFEAKINQILKTESTDKCT